MSTSKPESSDQALSKANSLLRSGNVAAAEQRLKAIIAGDPSCAGAYQSLAQIAVTTGNARYATPLLAEATRLAPESVEIVSAYVKHLLAVGEKTAAEGVLNVAIARLPGSKPLLALQNQLTGESTKDDLQSQVKVLENLAEQEAYPQLRTNAAAVLADHPGMIRVRYFHGLACLNCGETNKGINELSLVVQQEPKNDAAWGQLGIGYMQKGQLQHSLAAHYKAIAIKPSECAHHVNIAVALLETKDIESAEKHAQEALQLQGNSAAAVTVLGRIHVARGSHDSARKLFTQALRLKPSSAGARSGLAELAFAEGKLRDAELECRRLLAGDRNNVDIYNTLVDSLMGQEKMEDALEITNIGMKRVSDVTLWNRRAIAQQRLKKYADAISEYKGILREAPGYFPSMVNLAGTLAQTGQYSEAMEYFDSALSLPEANPQYASNWIFTHLYDPDLKAETIKELSEKWAQDSFANTAVYQDWLVTPEEPLRIGIVSGDFRNHPVGYFLYNVLRELQSLGVKINLYSTVASEDSQTELFKGFVDEWRQCASSSEAHLAQRIREDGVGILIDVAGHTAHNRLGVFAMRAAPIQITWLGYLSTTGLPTIDYIIGDPWVIPEGESDFYTEKPLVLPRTYQCLSKPQDSPEVAPLPALENGYVTFGSFNNYAKLNDQVIALWARVLLSNPGSKILLKNQVLTDEAFKERLRQLFAAHGVSPERLLLEASVSREHLLEAYGRVDVGLDPSPYTGCTTSFESLWMGVPVVTKAGDRFLSHAGESIMNNVGLPDWVAPNEDEYVTLATEKAADIAALAQLRAALRPQMLASPLMDAKAFASDFQEALHSVWSDWSPEKLRIDTL